eukprot:10107474-Alexandrium_andersonii.AAC.1
MARASSPVASSTGALLPVASLDPGTLPRRGRPAGSGVSPPRATLSPPPGRRTAAQSRPGRRGS